MTIKEAILTLNANVIVACERARFDPVTIKMIEDALDVVEDALQAQEPIKPKLGGNAGVFGTWWYQCGACSGQINPGDKYCNNCGKAVKWE